MINPQYFLMFILIFVSSSSHASLLFSEYVEGSSSNKALEIFNTGTTIDFNSGSYAVEIYSNGSSTPRYSINLVGIVEQNSTFVIGHSSADSAIHAVANLLTGSLSFNGDDAISLIYNGAIIDRIGQVGIDPGTEWGSGLLSTQNNTLRRQSHVVTGDINALDVFDPSLQWLGFDSDTFAGLGNHELDSLQQSRTQNVQPSASVPEPASFMLVMLGLLPLLFKCTNIRQFIPVGYEKLC